MPTARSHRGDHDQGIAQRALHAVVHVLFGAEIVARGAGTPFRACRWPRRPAPCSRTAAGRSPDGGRSSSPGRGRIRGSRRCRPACRAGPSLWVEDCSPFKPRSSGTPALVMVYICRENIIRSAVRGMPPPSRAHSCCTLDSASLASPMSIGVMPAPNSRVAIWSGLSRHRAGPRSLRRASSGPCRRRRPSNGR